MSFAQDKGIQMNTKLKVVTVTLNPALDLTGSLDVLEKGAVNQLDTSNLHPAGKGINVAKVLAELGAQVTVTGLLGDNNQAPFVQLFNALNIIDEFIRVEGASRINVKIVEKSGQVSDLNFPGLSINQAQLKQFEQTLFNLAKSHDLFVIAGSLPRGVSAQQLERWISALQKQGKKVLFDSSNQALISGIKANPYLIKPNNDELGAVIGKRLNDTAEIAQAAEKLHQQGCENIVISLGEKGVLWLNQAGWMQSTSPKMNIVSTVGAGDTLVAGLCWSLLNQWSKDKSLRFSTALAALAVSQTGVGVENKQQVETLQKEVQITTKLANI